MHRRPDPITHKPPSSSSSSSIDPSNARFFHEIQTLSKALALKDPNPRRLSLPSNPKPESEPRPKPAKTWSWKKPLKALSHLRHRRFDCNFSLHVHSIEGLPPPLSNATLVVHWRRVSDSSGVKTRPAKAFNGSAEFEETLTYRCSVYGSRSGAQGLAKYEPREFLIYATIAGATGFDFGKHRVEMTRILPVTVEELEGEKGSGEWNTSFGLAGKARGATLNVSFGYNVGGEQKGDGLQQVGSVQERSRIVEKPLEDSRVLREVVKQELDINSKLEESPEMKCCMLEEPVKGNEENECDELEFTVIEQGVEIDPRGRIGELKMENAELEAVNQERDLQIGECNFENAEVELVDQEKDLDLESLNIPITELEGLGSPRIEFETIRLNYKNRGMKSKSLNLDDESVASEFLRMLGLENSSGSDPESPRERLWKQFEKENLNANDSIFGLDPTSCDFAEEFDLSSIAHDSEIEHHKSRARMMEDAETEALMREWGLNEKVFESSELNSANGFGSPIDLPLEDLLELPPLGEDLRPFLQTKDGGFLRSMSPPLFKASKNSGRLVMQASSPVVVPAEMGSDIMEILQGLASIGIEKLSMQASKLMPLEDITGKTMQQVAWEASPSLETYERLDMLQHSNLEIDDTAVKRRKGKGSKQGSLRNGDAGSEFVSLEDLAPLAMDKIEALSIEGLRIQSGMSEDEAPSNISPQYTGEISAFEGKGPKNIMSPGLEGAGGLQLLDVKDSGGEVDGLMGLSITLDEWMRLDSGVVNEEEEISERTTKILAAHHAKSTDFLRADKSGGKSSGRRCGLLGNNFTVALMVQLRDPLRNYEPVGSRMLALIQVERVFVPPKLKVYRSVFERGSSEQDDEPEIKHEPLAKEKNKVEEVVIPQFKINEVHIAGLKTEPSNKKVWDNAIKPQSGSRWLLANGMGKSNKHPFMKSNSLTKPSQVTAKVQPGDTLWSISSRVHGNGAKWKELAALNPHIRNPNVIFPNETIRLC